MTEQDLDKFEKQVKELMTVGLHYSTQEDIKESVKRYRYKLKQ